MPPDEVICSSSWWSWRLVSSALASARSASPRASRRRARRASARASASFARIADTSRSRIITGRGSRGSSRDADHADHSRDADHADHSRDADHADHSRDADHADHSRDADHADHSWRGCGRVHHRSADGFEALLTAAPVIAGWRSRAICSRAASPRAWPSSGCSTMRRIRRAASSRSGSAHTAPRM